MNKYDQFHDGSLDGLLIDQTCAHVFLRTEEGQLFVVLASGVVAMAADGFNAGNIILDVLIRQDEELTLQDISEVYRMDSSRESQSLRLLAKAREQRHIFLEINPSYGATCLILADSIALIPREEWIERYLSRAV